AQTRHRRCRGNAWISALRTRAAAFWSYRSELEGSRKREKCQRELEGSERCAARFHGFRITALHWPRSRGAGGGSGCDKKERTCFQLVGTGSRIRLHGSRRHSTRLGGPPQAGKRQKTKIPRKI